MVKIARIVLKDVPNDLIGNSFFSYSIFGDTTEMELLKSCVNFIISMYITSSTLVILMSKWNR